MNCRRSFNFSALPLDAGEEVTEKPIEPIKVYSEKELIREMEKIASTLVPEKDWSIRIAAMQRVEGLICGGLWPLLFLAVNLFLYDPQRESLLFVGCNMIIGYRMGLGRFALFQSRKGFFSSSFW